MTGSIVGRLIAKDLYVYRWLIIVTLLSGLASMFMSGQGGATGNIGQILFVTTIVVLGVFLAIYGLISERYSRSLMFALSLPISPLQYTAAKVAASVIAFLIPWGIITATLVGLTVALDTPAHGTLPYTLAMMGLFLANFCFLMALGLITGSESWAIAGIIATNTSVPVFLGTVLPSLGGDRNGPVPVWSPAILTTLGIEAAVVVLSLGLTFYVQSRRKDFV
jgi:ABC-2 type transport system permease protein